jgi:dihydroorotate dehydrogenase
MYRFVYRHLLARVDAERTHELAAAVLSRIGSFPPARTLLRRALTSDTEGLAIKALGLDFDHPLGLAAGFDKDARCLPGVEALGFSFAEVGTVTPRPQPGNPRPRIFRLPEDAALINRMGFPSAGMDAVAHNLSHRQRSYPIGVSLGKNKDTALIDAHQDYCATLECLYPCADFFVINVSSPNTPDLRMLQAREYLTTLLSHLRDTIQSQPAESKPLLLKLSPDMSREEIDGALDLASTYGIGGIVATNTTTGRIGLRSPRQTESGGLSGRPLQARSSEVIRHIYRQTHGKLCIVGVGGIFSGDDIWEKLCAGASLVQAYTGLIDEGPTFVRRALRQLRQRMRDEGVTTLAEIVGSAHSNISKVL